MSVSCSSHIGYLPVEKLAQGLQSLGTLNIYLHVLTCHMVQKLLFRSFVPRHLAPLTDYKPKQEKQLA